MKKVLTIAGVAAMALTTTMCTSKKAEENPFLSQYQTPHEIPPFDEIKFSNYLSGMQAGIEEQNANIQAILDCEEEPTFYNTIVPLEFSSPTLDRVGMVIGALAESDQCPELDSISAIFNPAVTKQNDEVMMNSALFARVKAIHDDPVGLEPDQKRLVDKYYKNFIAAGALLNDEQKEELKAVNAQLADLYLQFNKNLLAATNDYQLVVDDPARLSGLPQSNIDNAAQAAADRGLEGKYVFTLHAGSRLPLLQFADDRELRKEMYQAYTTLASSGKYCNYPVINQILKARNKKARLLGFENFGAMMTDRVMAKNVDNARNLLMQIWEPAKKRVKQEVAEMQQVANAEGVNISIEPWDYYYYNEKVRQQKYDLDEAQVREYFPVDSVRKGIFAMAKQLYGINFNPMPEAPKYNPEVDVFEVTDENGKHVAVFMTDYYSRSSKRQGAWMFEFKGSWEDMEGISSRPVVYNVCNFAKPSGDTPTLLSIDEVETMFHEFGHGLQGMLTNSRYKSLAGTNVDRDYVELASQIHEHWATDPDFISQYAHHYQTGEPIPADLMKKLEAASTHNQGFRTTELVGAALLDLEYGELNQEDEDLDIEAFEKQVAEKLGLPKQLTYRYRSPYFKHIFGSDEYASGYYTYLWAEVLDTDGFELFKEKGIFDPETAKSFKENILEPGDNEDPMVLYTRFRGHEPSVDALLRNRGLK